MRIRISCFRLKTEDASSSLGNVANQMPEMEEGVQYLAGRDRRGKPLSALHASCAELISSHERSDLVALSMLQQRDLEM